MTRLEANAGMDNRTKLQSLCEMRCSNCDNALYTFKSALEYLEADGDGKYRNYLLSIERFDFIITLVTNYLRSKMTTESIWGLFSTHVYKDTELETDRIIHQFSRQKNVLSAPLFRPD